MVGDDRPQAAVRQVPSDAPRLVIMHDPASFEPLPGGSAPLAFAGHTHGGQIRVPGRPSWSLARLDRDWPQWADGWLDGYGEPGNRIYVNRGIGFSILPVRIGCRPEVTFVTLRRAEGAGAA
jgi:predicted MPP superfamily phosphohydrolase